MRRKSDVKGKRSGSQARQVEPSGGTPGSSLPASRASPQPFTPSARSPPPPSLNARPFVPATVGRANSLAETVQAQPFFPPSSGGAQRASPSVKLSQAAVNAAPFVPGAQLSSPVRQQPGINAAARPFVPRGLGTAASPGPSTQGQNRAEPRLPDGDEGLGMTAHTPNEASSSHAPSPRDVEFLGTMVERIAAASALQQQQQQAPVSPQRGMPQAPGQVPQRSPRSQRPLNMMYQPAAPGPSPGRMGPSPGRGPRGLNPGGGPSGGRMSGRRTPSNMTGSPPKPTHGSGQPPIIASKVPPHFTPEQMRQELQQRSYMVHAQADPEAKGHPAMIQQFHSIVALEEVSPAEDNISAAFGVSSTVFKGISTQDGEAYALRRLDGRQVLPSGELLAAAQGVIEAWSPLRLHPALLVPRSAFVSNEVAGQAALFMAYDFLPGAMTLEAAHVQPSTTAMGLVRNSASEELLWSYLVQLVGAVRAANSAGLALRAACLLPSKVLVTPHGRLHISCLGLPDVLLGEMAGREDAIALHREDLAGIGRLLLTLACAETTAPSLDYCSQHFSLDFTNMLQALLSSVEGGPVSHWRQLTAVLGERMLLEMEAQASYSDTLAAELGKEVENGRLLRLLVRLSMVTERPEGDMDPQWSETGDRYLLKLFRDYAFHQTSEDGAPVIDWGHVVEVLNKLDAGVPEKMLLLSRDETSMLVVSYADVKRCIEGAFNELKSRSLAARQRSRNERQAMRLSHKE